MIQRRTDTGRMKVEFLTQDDPLYILPLFEELSAITASGKSMRAYLQDDGEALRKKLISELVRFVRGGAPLSGLAARRF